jgi:hypothetical protein
MSDYPKLYWHCYVKINSKTSYSVENDLAFEQLQTRILIPWHQSAPFTIDGKIITKNTSIEEIKVTHTNEPQHVWAERHNADRQANGICDLATDRYLLPIHYGQDFTFELLFAGKKESAKHEEVDLIELVCRRISNAARILLNRSRKGKQAYEIGDEYDVQDLLHAILRAYLKYSVQEDPLPKVASAKSGKVDISVEEIGVLIEVKFVRTPDDQKRIFEEFSQDLVLYSSWKPLKTLFFLIYNSGDLRDPEAFEKLSGAKEIGGKKFDARIILS